MNRLCIRSCLFIDLDLNLLLSKIELFLTEGTANDVGEVRIYLDCLGRAEVFQYKEEHVRAFGASTTVAWRLQLYIEVDGEPEQCRQQKVHCR